MKLSPKKVAVNLMQEQLQTLYVPRKKERELVAPIKTGLKHSDKAKLSRSVDIKQRKVKKATSKDRK